MNLGASIEASVEEAYTEGQQTEVTIKYSITIPGGDDFWICQRTVFLNQYHTDNAVRIWDSDLKTKGPECKDDKSYISN